MPKFEYEDTYNDTLEVIFHKDGEIVSLVVKSQGNFPGVDLPRQVAVQMVNDLSEALALEVKKETANAAVDPVSILAGSTGNETYEWNRVAVQAAEALGLGIEFRYAKTKDSPIESRSLSKIHGIFTNADGDILVEGVDHDRDDDARSFRLDRIKGFVTVTR